LQSSGDLTGGQANALRKHLAGILQKIQAGDYCVALVQLNAFRQQVENLVDEEALSPEAAEQLLGGATDVIQGYPHFASISAGSGQSCGLTPEGTAWCWGFMVTTTPQLTPVLVAPGSNLTFSSISVGDGHACGLTAAGEAWCWGGNGFGQLGDGTTTFRPLPVPVAPGTGLRFTSLRAGEFRTCGVASDGTGYCWGRNLNGELGNGTEDDSALPVVVGPGLGLTFAVVEPGTAMFGSHSCGVTTDHRAFCWGNSTVFGMLGDGGFAGSAWPVEVGPGLGLSFTTVSAGASHNCATTSGGVGYCWGANGAGQLGNGTADFSFPNVFPVPVPDAMVHRLPEPVTGGHTFSTIDGGGTLIFFTDDNSQFYRSFTCGLSTGGAALCWGNNRFGQVGDGTTTDRPSPTPVAPVLGGLAAISTGSSHACGLSSFGRAYCWDYNAAGQLGDGTQTDRHVPVAVKFN
jgi:alpha-tubulin suppressor-like RCC1 family protein